LLNDDNLYEVLTVKGFVWEKPWSPMVITVSSHNKFGGKDNAGPELHSRNLLLSQNIKLFNSHFKLFSTVLSFL